ncbi:MAG TPA: lysophospholipid acyltransferase family protein [Myxococcaceae bacterium]|nr:lysophospholipid acyltransferase family protein [Myxococcaceae bacterium]
MGTTTMDGRSKPFYLFMGVLSHLVLRGAFRLKVSGVEHLPKDTGFVLAANHLSNLDPWPLGLAAWPRPIHFMAKAEIFDSPVLGRFVAAQGAFPVRRGERDTGAVERAITFARGGDPVVMFPEGTRRLPGRQIKHHTGAARVALEAGVPLIPAGISGTDRLNRLGAQRVLYGPPVDLDDLKGMPSRDGAVEGTRRLMEAIHRLEAQLAGGKGR